VTTVKRALASTLLLASALAVPGAARAAEALAFVHDATIYIDAKEGRLKRPEGVACSASGYVVVADTGNARLVMYEYKDTKLSGGTELKLDQLPSPQRVQITSKGDVLVLDGKTRKIVRVSQAGAFGGFLEPKGLSGDVVVGAFKVDAGDGLLVLDVRGKRVAVLDPEGKLTREVALPPESGVVTDVTADAAGTLYAVDAVGATIWSAEKGATAFKALTKSMKDRMSFPTYITSWRNHLFVVDQNGSGVVILGLDGAYQGRQLSIGWSDGLVNYPTQLCFRDDGTAFVADRFNNRVQAFATGK
jgi:hypothetical protein